MTRAVDRICYPVFIASPLVAVVLGLVMIWGSFESPVLARTPGSAVVLAVASALALSATRVVEGTRLHESRRARDDTE